MHFFSSVSESVSVFPPLRGGETLKHSFFLSTHFISYQQVTTNFERFNGCFSGLFCGGSETLPETLSGAPSGTLSFLLIPTPHPILVFACNRGHSNGSIAHASVEYRGGPMIGNSPG
jgi:hypothetical protein